MDEKQILVDRIFECIRSTVYIDTGKLVYKTAVVIKQIEDMLSKEDITLNDLILQYE
jgi:hypothetical protein